MKFLTALRTELGQLSYSLKARKTPQQWRDQYVAIRGIRIFNTPSVHYRGPRTEVWGIAMVKDEIDILPYIQRAQSHHQVGEPVPGNWIRRSLVYFGEVSFAFYLVHEIVIFRFIKTSLGRDMVRMDARGILMMLIILVISILAAIIAHHAIERPDRIMILKASTRTL